MLGPGPSGRHDDPRVLPRRCLFDGAGIEPAASDNPGGAFTCPLALQIIGSDSLIPDYTITR